MLKQNKNKEYQEKLKLVARTFMTFRQLGNYLQLNEKGWVSVIAKNFFNC